MANRVTYLGELEQMILWAVVRLGDDAYGMAIRDELERRTGRAASRGGVYVTLDRLVGKGYLSSSLGAGDERRSGRRRRYFALTEPGRAALREARAAIVNLWSGVESVVENQ